MVIEWLKSWKKWFCQGRVGGDEVDISISNNRKTVAGIDGQPNIVDTGVRLEQYLLTGIPTFCVQIDDLRLFRPKAPQRRLR